MSRWQVRTGLLACAVWSVLLASPLIPYHMNSQWLGAVDHVHAAVLFVLSEFLVFWLFGRKAWGDEAPAAQQQNELNAGDSQVP